MDGDLISRKALRNKCLGWLHTDSQEADAQDDMAASMVMEIDAAPAENAEIVRHGRWIETHEQIERNGHLLFADGVKCSDCGKHGDGREWCSSCGCKMDAQEEA